MKVHYQLAKNILTEHSFKGCFSIDNLPSFEKYPASYLVHVDPIVWFAIIRYSEDELVLFNPASRLIAIPGELTEELSDYCNVTILDCDVNFIVKHMFGTCIFFIYHCSQTYNNLYETFPKDSSYIQHMENIHDFLKVKSHIHFNKW